MIPDNIYLNEEIVNYLIANKSKSFFATAEEYVKLQQKFLKETLLDKILLWVDLLLSPLITLYQCISSGEMPSMFTAMSLQKTFTLWGDYIKFKLMAAEMHEWTKMVRSVHGPFISCNDPTYHMFVYADGMERLRLSLNKKKDII